MLFGIGDRKLIESIEENVLLNYHEVSTTYECFTYRQFSFLLTFNLDLAFIV